MDKPQISNLDILGADPEKLEEYRLLKAAYLEKLLRLEQVRRLIVQRGGNIHGVNRKETNKRRAKRKAHHRATART